MTFIEICQNDKSIQPEYWSDWLKEVNSVLNKPNYQLLGLQEEQYQDLINKKRTMTFFIFKKQQKRLIDKLWTGCYVKFVYENDCARNPHFQRGWIDVIDNKTKLCKIQCDDSFNGMRALILNISDIIQILPYKERPLIYYKTMICGDCNDCDRASNEINQESCPHFYFFNAIISKQQMDNTFISSYEKIKEEQHNVNPNQINCHCGDCSEN